MWPWLLIQLTSGTGPPAVTRLMATVTDIGQTASVTGIGQTASVTDIGKKATVQ